MSVHPAASSVSALGVFWVLSARKVKELCLGGSFFLLVLVQQVVFFLLQRSAIQTLVRDGMLVAHHPAQYGLIASAVTLVLFLVFYVAGNAARERESGTLETLFYGPVSATVHVLAEIAAIVVAVVVSYLTLTVSLLVGAYAVGYGVPVMVLTVAGLSVITVVALSAVTLFLTYVFRQARVGMIAVVALVALSVLLFASNYLLSRGDLAGAFFLLFVRASVSGMDAVFRFVFPLGLLLDDIVRYLEQGTVPLFHVFYYPAYAGAFLLCSIRVLGRSGVVVR